ncbi:MAG: PPC domain-containing protein, partial [Nitrososphaera sp.]|nr:PPC domain-containing protein [Nitrososphaera sp.]
MLHQTKRNLTSADSPLWMAYSCLSILAYLLFLSESLVMAQNRADSSKVMHDVLILEPGKPIERELKGGEVHTYQIVLNAGQYLHVVVDQRGIDVVVTLFAPDGKQLTEVDSPNGTQGPEPISEVVEVSGRYQLKVRSLENAVGLGR